MSLVAWYPLNGDLKDISGNHYDLNMNCLYGDVNKSGSITQDDLDLATSFALGTTPTKDQLTLSDINQDGQVTPQDLSEIMKFVSTGESTTIVNQPSNIKRIDPTWVDGKTGRYALALDKNYLHTNLVCIDQLKNKPLEFSVSFWIKQGTVIKDYMDILGFQTYKESDNTTKWLRIEPTSFPDLRWFNNTHLSTDTGYIAISSKTPLNEWIHLASVFSSTGITFYKNGKFLIYWDYQNSPKGIKLVGNFRIGSTETQPSNSILNNIKIYDHCLSKEEAYQDYLSPMLHYTFEQSYAEETERIPHTLSIADNGYTNIVQGIDSKGVYFTKTPATPGSTEWSAGPELDNDTVYGGNYYTWSLEVNPDIDLTIEENADAFANIDGVSKKFYFDRNISPTSTWLNNDAGCDVVDSYFGNIPKNTWTRVWLTVYVQPAIGKAKLFHRFSPVVNQGQVKVYYRNSMLEKKDHMTPYTRDRREQQLIRDTSGQGNDGKAIYKRDEVLINISTYSRGGCKVAENNKIFTINNFSVNPNTNTRSNVVANLYKMPKNWRYHNLNSIISYEFDVKLENIVIEDGETFSCKFQGITYKSNGNKWLGGGPVHVVDITPRLRGGRNGTYHITIEKKIINAETIDSTTTDYDIQLRFDHVQSGKVVVSNFHAYYKNLDTSTLGITDRDNAIGTHSAHFNGKNFIDCGIVTPKEMDSLTLSCWIYSDNYENLRTDYVDNGTLEAIMRKSRLWWLWA